MTTNDYGWDAKTLWEFSTRLLVEATDLDLTHNSAFTNGIRWAAADAAETADAIEKGTTHDHT